MEIPPDVAVDGISAGKSITVQFYFANKGSRPVYGVQTWGMLIPLDPEKNDGERVRKTFLNEAEKGYKEFKGKGGELGVGLEYWNFARLDHPFTEAEISDLASGKKLLYFIIWGVWTDRKGNPSYWGQCYAAQIPPTLNISSLAWRNCT